MKRFFTYLKTELKLSVRDMNMVIFAVIMPLVIFIILGIIYGTKPAYDGADYMFLEQSFGAVSAVAICAGGLMGLLFAGFMLLPGWILGFCGYMSCFVGVNLFISALVYMWLRKKGVAILGPL